MNSPRLYIATRDPRDSGGVRSMASFIYRAAENSGYDPCIVCNMLNGDAQVRVSQPLRAAQLDPAQNIQHTNLDGLEIKGIPLILPEVEFTHYFLNRSGWLKATEDGDLFFAVGGTNQCNLPFVDRSVRFGSWTATLLWEDRIDRLQSAPTIERIRDHLSRPLLERLEKKAFEAANPTIVLSEYTADQVRKQYNIEPDEIIPYPIDTQRFSAEATGGEPSSNGPVVLFVGRFNDPRKNTRMLINAFSKVRETVPDAELWLVGADPNKRVNDAISENGLEEALTCYGRIPNDDLPRYYRAADLFVIPSSQEGLAIVGLEAMACRTPVIATRCGGPEQYVINDETGYLVPKDDASAMAERIIDTLVDESRRERLSYNSENLIHEQYNASKVRNRFQAVLKELDETTSA